MNWTKSFEPKLVGRKGVGRKVGLPFNVKYSNLDIQMNANSLGSAVTQVKRDAYKFVGNTVI